MRAFVAIMVCASALMPLDALADWQYAKWGMSPEEVVGARIQWKRAAGVRCRSQEI
jgi:hypothetical protein